MSTQIFFRSLGGNSTPLRFSLGTNAAKLDGTAIGWGFRDMDTARGSANTADTVATVAGPTSGLEFDDGLAWPIHWISAPIDQDVTISGTITFNLWMGESATAANAGAQCVIERINSTGAVVSTIANSEKGTELPKTSAIAAQNWTATPTSTNMKKGDRIRIRPAANDAGGTMAAANTVTFDCNGPTAAADGDSYVTFTETFGFLTTDPTTQSIFPTTAVSDVDPGGAGTDTKEAWTGRGSGSTDAVTNTAAGWTAPLQCTVSAGGNFVEWFTKQLTAFTLTAPVLIKFHGLESNASANVSIRAEIAVCASDGTSPTVWAATTTSDELSGLDAARSFYVAGADLAVTDGQRIRLRFYLDDIKTDPMGTGFTATVSYAGTTGGAAGDSFFTFGQTFTEFVAVAGAFVRPFAPIPFIPQGRSM